MIDNKLRDYLMIHIPYRLQAIDGLQWACQVIIKYQKTNFVQLHIDGVLAASSNSYRFITNPMLEVGLLYCRVLLEFLGIGLNINRNKLKEKTDLSIKPDDININNFGLNRLTINQVCDVPFASSIELEQAYIYTILTADKAVAHLTIGPNLPQNINNLSICSKAVPFLICKYLYTALGLREPNYKMIKDRV